ncbi:RES family NAD+ phosphorylase [Lamprocystis purpurea]|jgi:RES domain-containing protein|uniref:RES family NAD+ phosphorylase n=1 Tax=Lamprocystis purpurea TaxID=61598 RepID=UPI00037911F4|nr:RES domain-containing protein [Lamprocystis purpurea]
MKGPDQPAPLPLIRRELLTFRAHHPRWAFAPTSGEGAARRGGRFNPPGTPALYTSLTPTTAWMEAQQGLPYKAQPMTLVAYRVNCAALIDLTHAPTLAALGIAADVLATPWEDLASCGIESPTWILARRLIGAGAAACLAPSFAPGVGPQDRNLILWRWQAQDDCRVEVIDDLGRLPKDDRSWG